MLRSTELSAAEGPRNVGGRLAWEELVAWDVLSIYRAERDRGIRGHPFRINLLLGSQKANISGVVILAISWGI
jgi:hypothetical protein